MVKLTVILLHRPRTELRITLQASLPSSDPAHAGQRRAFVLSVSQWENLYPACKFDQSKPSLNSYCWPQWFQTSKICPALCDPLPLDLRHSVPCVLPPRCPAWCLLSAFVSPFSLHLNFCLSELKITLVFIWWKKNPLLRSCTDYGSTTHVCSGCRSCAPHAWCSSIQIRTHRPQPSAAHEYTVSGYYAAGEHLCKRL